MSTKIISGLLVAKIVDNYNKKLLVKVKLTTDLRRFCIKKDNNYPVNWSSLLCIKYMFFYIFFMNFQIITNHCANSS